MCKSTQNVKRQQNFFLVPNIFDTDISTFFDTNFFRYRFRGFLRYQFVPIPVLIPPVRHTLPESLDLPLSLSQHCSCNCGSYSSADWIDLIHTFWSSFSKIFEASFTSAIYSLLFLIAPPYVLIARWFLDPLALMAWLPMPSTIISPHGLVWNNAIRLWVAQTSGYPTVLNPSCCNGIPDGEVASNG